MQKQKQADAFRGRSTSLFGPTGC